MRRITPKIFISLLILVLAIIVSTPRVLAKTTPSSYNVATNMLVSDNPTAIHPGE